MQEMLLNSAESLDPVPARRADRAGNFAFLLALGKTTTGLPAQIVMHGPKKLLLEVKTGAGR